MVYPAWNHPYMVSGKIELTVSSLILASWTVSFRLSVLGSLNRNDMCHSFFVFPLQSVSLLSFKLSFLRLSRLTLRKRQIGSNWIRSDQIHFQCLFTSSSVLLVQLFFPSCLIYCYSQLDLQFSCLFRKILGQKIFIYCYKLFM